jgi:hypothetical protein
MRAAIVYEGTALLGARIVACDQRLRVKQWANTKLGQPVSRANTKLGQPVSRLRKGINSDEYQYINTNGEWYQGYNDAGEYVIAFQNPQWRDWALLL